MHTNRTIEHGGYTVRAVVTDTETGRYSAAAILTDRDGETRTLGVDGDFADTREASDQALELALAWIQRRSVVSDRYVRRYRAMSSSDPDHGQHARR
ncbi:MULTISPECIES: hypothetical protein [unclassified Burkholderia]|uniref:hypothetical protein n=1 Tax=unclassified Burkholderia TaxID=2613784 RepID=UPI00084C5C93|nr:MULTISPECIES: hypothetical protein [unclassified Burkholderia]RQU17771.1 hypothetical protein DF152_10045 [Burkholderia cenocepacia]MBR8236068.1 hypothetical protein [Burkholderia sp. AU32357]MBY4871748.1 hypothetical protein [Burkholderia sp. AU42008]OED10668.1 hypothetical protein A9Z05_29070 [Burkholderia sp. A2]OXI37837.1 hypothetical protein CFB49_32960 [Burkholderia sp. AU17457]